MKYGANITVDWGRLAGLGDDDNQLGAEFDDPTAGAAVDVTDPRCSSVAWNLTLDGTPIEISVRACNPDQTKSVQVASTVAKAIQAALRARAAAAPAGSAAQAVLAALVPVQARAAVKAARVVVNLARSGQLRSALSRLRGGARVIGRALA